MGASSTLTFSSLSNNLTIYISHLNYHLIKVFVFIPNQNPEFQPYFIRISNRGSNCYFGVRIKDRFRSVNLVKLLVCVKIENCERMVVNGNRVDGEVEVAAHGLFLHHDVVEVLVVECASLALPPRWP